MTVPENILLQKSTDGNSKIISFKKLFHHSQLGASQKEKKSGALGTCPVCPLVKMALFL